MDYYKLNSKIQETRDKQRNKRQTKKQSFLKFESCLDTCNLYLVSYNKWNKRRIIDPLRYIMNGLSEVFGKFEKKSFFANSAK